MALPVSYTGYMPPGFQSVHYPTGYIKTPAIINVPTGAPIWGTWQMCNGTVGIAYDHHWDLEGCASPTTYTLQSGSLPTGLSLASISGNQGHISGTPTVAGTYAFTLRATNSIGVTDQSFTIVIAAASGGGEVAHSFVV